MEVLTFIIIGIFIVVKIMEALSENTGGDASRRRRETASFPEKKREGPPGRERVYTFSRDTAEDRSPATELGGREGESSSGKLDEGFSFQRSGRETREETAGVPAGGVWDTRPYATSESRPYATRETQPYATEEAQPYATAQASPYAVKKSVSFRRLNISDNEVRKGIIWSQILGPPRCRSPHSRERRV